MPGINGLEVLRRVKKTNPAIQIIILTGHGSDKDEKEARDSGAFDYLQKPVDFDVLFRTLQHAYRMKVKSSPEEP